MPDATITTLGLVLLVASIVAMICRRFDLPYSVGLVAAGIALQLSPIDVELRLSRDLIFDVFLPPLVFEAALQLPWKFFKRNLPVTALLAFPGLVVAAAFVAAGMHYLVGWDWMGSALFGTLMAATDPVSVIASFKELGVRPRLSLLVESESLANDGTAAVGFGLLVAIHAGASSTPIGVLASLLWTVIGGIAIGGAVAAGALMLAKRTDDHLVENTLTAIAAYGSFLIADHFGMSGVLASMTAGLVVGNVGLTGPIAKKSRPHVVSMWQFAAFLANSIVFILIGAGEADVPLHLFAGAAAIGIALVLGGRALAVYPFCRLLRPTRLRVSMAYQHALFWGGLRGALGLALALALPPDLADRSEIIIVAFAVVAFSIFAQGLTMPWVTRKLGVVDEGGAHYSGPAHDLLAGEHGARAAADERAR